MASQDGQKSEFFKIRNSSLNIKKNFEYKNVFENWVSDFTKWYSNTCIVQENTFLISKMSFNSRN